MTEHPTVDGGVCFPDRPETSCDVHRLFDDIPIQTGDRLSYKLPDGSIYTGVVTSYEEDEETGVVTMTLAQWPDSGPGYASLPT